MNLAAAGNNLARSLIGYGRQGCLFMFLLIAGCAVTEIDVDVYKGPLTNDPDIQTEQTVAMAIGAKPLLVQLRDYLEWGPEVATIAKSRKRFQREGSYRDGYMAPMPPTDESPPGQKKYHQFQDDQAKQVNEVLELYENLPQARHESEVWAKFKSDLAVLNERSQIAADPGSDQELWVAVSKTRRTDAAVRVLQRLKLSPDQIKGQAALIEKLTQGLNDLQAAYGEFVAPEKGHLRGRDIFKAHDRLTNILKSVALPVKVQVEGLFPVPDHSTPTPEQKNQVSSNRVFELLRQRSYVVADADIFFEPAKNSTDNRKQFEDRVVEIADAFVDSRLQLLRLFDIGLYDILKADNRGSAPEVAAAAELVASLVRPTYLFMALHNENALWMDDPNVPGGRKPSPVANLRDALLDSLSIKQQEDINEWEDTSGKRELIENALVRILSSDPKKYVPALREAHLLLTNEFAPDEGLAKTKPTGGATDLAVAFVKYPAWRFDGIVRGPGPEDAISRILQIFPPADTFHDSNLVPELVEEKLRNVAVALEGGRGEEGIEKLTSTYIEKLNSTPRAPENAADERVRLLEELARFAQKILFVANYEQLISSETIRSRNSTSSRQEAERKAAATASYGRVLQAVGNSILVQVDELRRNSRWQSDSQAQWRLEALASHMPIPPAQKGAHPILGDGLDFWPGPATPLPTSPAPRPDRRVRLLWMN